jgi:hypothetical protein
MAPGLWLPVRRVLHAAKLSAHSLSDSLIVTNGPLVGLHATTNSMAIVTSRVTLVAGHIHTAVGRFGVSSHGACGTITRAQCTVHTNHKQRGLGTGTLELSHDSRWHQ